MPGTAQHKQGEFIQADFFDNSAGLNLTDSPFRVGNGQATAGYAYDYTATGGLRKRNGHTLANATPDAQLRTLGFGLHATPANLKTLLRAAGTAFQTVNVNTLACTNQSEDTAAAGTSFFSGTQPVVSAQFLTPTSTLTWMAGGGLSLPYAYTGTKVTKNGSNPATGAITATAAGTGGVFPSTGTYWYAVVLRKASTQATSNAALDTSVSVTATTQQVTINLAGLTGLDQTKYDQIWIYRSATNGVTGFTTGDLIAQLASSATSYTDTGAYLATSLNIARAGNTILDNSVLPAGTYNTLTVFKRRLVTASGSTVYISDLNKPESWPTTNAITIPSGGPITGLAVISFTSPQAQSLDEILVIFKERELWVFTGKSVSDWELKFIDYTGCIAQNLAVFANGFLTWIDYRGVYIWDGAGKPIYASRPIEFLFGPDGDLDRSNLNLGCGQFFRKQNQVVWYVSSSTLGVQQLCIKMDLRLTLPMVETALLGRVVEGVFLLDTQAFPVYACFATLPNYDETFYAGDAAGDIWKLFDNGNSDNGTGQPFSYRTKTQDFDQISTTKRYHKVIVWCRDSTSNKLTLNYWTGYKTDADNMSTQSYPVTNAVSNAVWDQASWDAAYWDQFLINYTPVVFELNSAKGVEGDALTLEFVQKDPNSPLIIAGWSVLYTTLGIRKTTS